MKLVVAAILALAVLAASRAEAQFHDVAGAGRKHPVSVPSPSPGGGFLIGADDCATPHTNAGTGDVFGVAFDLCTGTTGATGQAEGICLFFGTTGIDNDVWFDWTASATGNGRFSNCGQTGVDTKAAVWVHNGASSCPVTSIACNDDACGLQTTVVWPVTSGTSYTIQLGTFPGAACGAGTFSVEQLTPPPCGQYDDGSTENSLGLTAGGEIAWIHSFDCLTTITGAETAYGTLMFPGSVTNGAGSRVAVYDDIGGTGDPTQPHTLLEVVNTVVVNGDTDILNPVAFTAAHNIPGSTSFVLATADHLAGQFPGPMDQDNPVPQAWVAGNTAGPGSMDLTNLNNNPLAPLQMQAIGFPASWLLRGEGSGGPPLPCGGTTGEPLGFCDGSGTAAPCGNEAPGQTGCLNGLGVGAGLGGTGTASLSNDTLTLVSCGIPAQPGLFFQGDTFIGLLGTNCVVFGDGLRCVGVNVIRLEVVLPTGIVEPTSTGTSIVISQHPQQNLLPGDTRGYQYWYRNPGTSPCGSNFNLSNALRITWAP